MPRFQPIDKRPTLQTTSLWDFPSQHYGAGMQGNADYIGATPSYLIWNLLHRYTKPGDLVVDPMVGSGTTIDVAKDLGRKVRGFDISPSRGDIEQADARRLPLDANSVDFAFVDPPYSTHIRYSGKEACIGELDAREPYYYEAMEEVIASLYRALKPLGYLALYVSDSQAKGKTFCPIGFELFFRMSRLMEPVDIIAVTRHNKSLKRNHWHTSAIEGNYFLRGFNYLFIMRKPGSDSKATLDHSQAGILSPLFIKAQQARAGEVVSPESFSEFLQRPAEELTQELSRKQQKKLRTREVTPSENAGKQRAAGAAQPRKKGRGPQKSHRRY